jgi:hypothetical protein
MPPERRVIPAGQEDLLRRMLDPPEGLPGGWQFVQAAVAGEGLEARYQLGTDVAVVRLVPADAAGEGALRMGSFAIDAAGGLPAALVDALEVSVLAREHRVRWSRPSPADIDPEQCAVEAGVARAIRRRAGREQARALEQRMLERGMSVVRLEPSHAPGEPLLLYAAKNVTDAEWVRDAEQRLQGSEPRSSERHARLEELGWALGYPSCCVEAFAGRREPTMAGVAGSLLSGSLGCADYRAARAAWVPWPAPRLNRFHRALGRALIPFEPCRYDCARALYWADQVAAPCATLDPDWLTETDRMLAEPVVIAPGGALALVAIERRIEPMRIIAARALAAAATDPRFVERLLGAEARDDGLLVGDAIGWSLLVDFGSASVARRQT